MAFARLDAPAQIVERNSFAVNLNASAEDETMDLVTLVFPEPEPPATPIMTGF